MDSIRDYYNQKEDSYGISGTRKKKIFRLLGDVKNKKILDVGCGDGRLGEEIIKNGGVVYGIDISDKSVDLAKKVLNEAACVDVQQEKLPYPDNFFDVVIMGEIIEHLINPEKALMEIKRILKNDGFIVITTPNFLVFSNRIKMLLGKFEYTETGFLDRGHIHFFHVNSFEKMINSLGLKIDAFNNVYHGKVPERIGRIIPSLFAFQIVARVSKRI